MEELNMRENHYRTTDNETSLLEDEQLRDSLIKRIDVLDKVKELFLLPELECLTIKQVADYYEVDLHTVQVCYMRNKEEINLDGVRTETPKTIKEFLKVTTCAFKNLEQLNGKLVMQVDDNTTIVIPNRGIKMFPKRAILRIGMLLRDSEVAKEVRTQLLNVFENTEERNPESLTQAIDEEETLALNVAKAYMTGDMLTFAEATMALNQFHKRHIEKLQVENKQLSEDNDILANKIIKLPMRNEINRMMRMLSYKLNIDYAMVWNIVYKQLKYKYGINLKNRGDRKKPYIQYLKEDEFSDLQDVISALLVSNNISPSDFFAECKII